MTERIAVMMFAYLTVLCAMWWTTRLHGTERKQLLSAILAGFIGLVLVFVIDKLATGYQLLTDSESELVFGLVENIMMLIVGFYFAKIVDKNE